MHEPLHITVVDPDSQTVEKVREATEEYLSVITPNSSPDAILDTVLQHRPVEVIILELERPFDKMFTLLSELKSRVQAEVVFVSRFDDEALWIETIPRGAYDHLCKPLGLPELKRFCSTQSKSTVGEGV
jgi:DNA-binding NarL/FixJ family response regulator